MVCARGSNSLRVQIFGYHLAGTRLDKIRVSVVTCVRDFGRVERLVLAHFLLHYVLHDPRVERLAGFLIGHVELLRVVGQWLSLILTTSTALSLRLITDCSSLFLVLAIAQVVFRALLEAGHIIALVAVRGRAWQGGQLVNDAHFRQLGRILQPLELGVEKLRTRLNKLPRLVRVRVCHLAGRVALLRLRVAVAAIRGHIGTLSVSERG